jgi:Fe-S cluster biogenesis protein NfuA
MPTMEDHVPVIVAVLAELQPLIQMDGGSIEFVRYEDTKVYVKLAGACVHCPMSMYTLKMGVEAALKELLPAITQVIAISPVE